MAMINNYFTLEAILNEIRDDIESSTIISSFTKTKRTLDIVLMKEGRKPSLIKISCIARQSYIFLRRNLSSIPGGANVFPGITGSRIIDAGVVRHERIIIFSLSNQQRLVVRLFGTHSNIYLTDSGNRILDRFLKRGLGPGEKINLVQKELNSQNKAPGDLIDFKSNDLLTAEDLLHFFPYLSHELASEVIFRFKNILKYSSVDKLSDVGHASIQTLLNDILNEILDELSHPSPHIYYKQNRPYLFSIIKLKHLSNLECEPCESVNAAVIKYISESDRYQATEDLKASLSKTIREKIEDIKRTIEKIEKEIAEHRERKYRMYAEILMENLTSVGGGSSSYTAKYGNEIVTVPLDPKLKAIQNAQLYFEKAKKAKISQSQTLRRKEELELELKKLESELSQVELLEGQQQLKSIIKLHEQGPSAQNKFHQFNLQGYAIYVGKNIHNNEELTFNYARPNDVFLHVRGASGSHVIIRNGTRNYPPQKIIEYAAELAAHYSKARSSSIVPVAYTMKKYVRKVKGQPGTVQLSREEVIFVSPKKPSAHK
ncbi:MAG: NFACT RNA binding domain-containing protein [Candidatus Kryptoniota bacterium]